MTKDFPGGPVVKTSPSNSGAEGSIPVRNLRSHMPGAKKLKNVKQKQSCNRFNKDFKNGPHQKKSKKKKKKRNDNFFFLISELHIW